MNAIAMIPARYASTRLPGKPLLAETGKPLLAHVVEQVRRARHINRIVVATDDERIRQAAVRAEAEVVMTSPSCRSGTDRLAEAAASLKLPDETIIINVQGDEPEIPPRCIDLLVEMIARDDAPMATLATPLPAQQADDPARVKVVLDSWNRALYFSRARIPHDRDGDGQTDYLLHLGVYAYRAGFLHWFAVANSTPAESVEKLEQLRVLESGHNIRVQVVDYHGQGIDTREDYDQFVKRVQSAG
ncbi:MAG: 3-deoxy-manno-octulosonate cytidylyltransferase [Phycisphaerae bacterium]